MKSVWSCLKIIRLLNDDRENERLKQFSSLNVLLHLKAVSAKNQGFEFEKRKCIQWFLKQMLELISQLLCCFHQMGAFSAWKSSWWRFTSEISFAQDTDVLPIEKHHSLHFSFFILKSCKSGFPSFYVGEWGAFVEEGREGWVWRWHFTTDISCLKLHSSIQETLTKSTTADNIIFWNISKGTFWDV